MFVSLCIERYFLPVEKVSVEFIVRAIVLPPGCHFFFCLLSPPSITWSCVIEKTIFEYINIPTLSCLEFCLEKYLLEL